MIVYDIFNIGQTVENFVRNIFWGIIQVLMNMLTGMLEAMIKGVLSFGVLNNAWVTEAFQACMTVMFLVLPVKIIYEILFSLLTDNEQTLDISRKIMGCITAVIIASSLPTAIPLINNLTVGCATAVTSAITNENNSLGSSLLTSVYVGFGGMAENGTYGAKNLVTNYTKSDFDIKQRNENDEYVWNFSEFMTIVGLAIYVILIFFITIQIASRIFMIAMMYILGPVCCASLTKYQDPQAFNVWKNSIMGQMAMNFSQILSLSFLASLVSQIGNIGNSSFKGLPVVMAQLALYLGAFTFIIALPNFVQGLIGGYSSGIMETLNSMSSGLRMAKAGTIGLASGTVAATVGKRNSYTGYREGGLRGLVAGNKRQNGTRTGGIIGNTIGNKDIDGNRQGGIRGAVAGDTINQRGAKITSGGILGGIRGVKSSTTGEDGSKKKSYTGGMRGFFAGNTDSVKRADGSSHITRTGGVRGLAVGDKNVDKKADGSMHSLSSRGVAGMVRGTKEVSRDTDGNIEKSYSGGLRGRIMREAGETDSSTNGFSSSSSKTATGEKQSSYSAHTGYTGSGSGSVHRRTPSSKSRIVSIRQSTGSRTRQSSSASSKKASPTASVRQKKADISRSSRLSSRRSIEGRKKDKGDND